MAEVDSKRNGSCSLPAIISIGIYAVSGPLIILVNKTIIKEHGFHAPAFVSSMGIIFTGLSSHLFAAMGLIKITPIGASSKTALMPILSVGACTALSFWFGNKAYEYLDAGFLQMMKAATPALLMLALIIFRIERISVGVSLCALVMVGGSMIAVLHAPHLNMLGIVIQLSSQGFEVMQNVLMQFFLQKLKFNALDAGYYIAPCTAVCCLILTWSLEAKEVAADGGQLVLSQVPWLCASGLVGVAVNFSSFFVIQYISSLMAKLVVVARSAALVSVLIVFFHEAWSPLQIVGYSITLIAFTGYSYLKATEPKEPPRGISKDGLEEDGLDEGVE